MVLAILDKGKPIVRWGRKARSRRIDGRPVAETMVESGARLVVGSSARREWVVCSRSSRVMNLLKTFLTEEDGPTAVEYAVMLSLIVVVCIVAVRAIGTSASSTFNR